MSILLYNYILFFVLFIFIGWLLWLVDTVYKEKFGRSIFDYGPGGDKDAQNKD